MGHIVNPIIFRLGIAQSGVKWVSHWFFNKQRSSHILKFIFDDYIIINYVFNFFKYLKKQSRQLVFTKFSKKIQKKLGTNKFRKRVRFFSYIVQRQSLVVSHIKIIRILDLLKVGIFFFDSTFVIKFNNYLNRRVFFSFLNYKKWKKEQRDEASLLSVEEKRQERRNKRYARKKIIALMRERKSYKIRSLFPLQWFERKLKKPNILNYLGTLNRFTYFIMYKRLFKNYFQVFRNNFSFHNIYKNLLWYILAFRTSFNDKFNNGFFSEFILKNYSFKFSLDSYMRLLLSALKRKHKKKIKNYLHLRIYIYNKFFTAFKDKLRFLVYKRLCALFYLLKDYTLQLEESLMLMEENVTTSVLYLNSLDNYRYCCTIIEFVYFELNNLKGYFMDKSFLLNTLKDFSFQSKIKLKKFTGFLLNIKLKKLVRFFQFRSFKKKRRKFIKLFFLSKMFNLSVKRHLFFISFSHRIKSLFNIFKVLYLLFIKRIDWFFFKYLRRFFFKLFLYCSFQLLSLLHIKMRFYYKKNIGSLYKYLGGLFLKLIIVLQKQKYLYKRRLFKYNFLFQLRFHLFYIYSLLFKSSRLFFNQNLLDFNFFGLNNKSVTSGVIVNYICKLLKKRYPITYILRNVIFDLKRYAHYIAGFRVICAGRLTKKQRAFYILKSSGAVKLSTIKVNMDYATDFVVMRFGTVGFKVWLTRSRFFVPYFYKLEYNFF